MLDEGRKVVVEKYNHIKQINDVDERSINFTKFRLALYGGRKQQQKTTPGMCSQMGNNSTIPELVHQTNIQ